ncbi:hypothetical protein L1887_30395 [Cichorium endivia]|nr:hypothetical protein L1887_30395 [Cichorium endivia]
MPIYSVRVEFELHSTGTAQKYRGLPLLSGNLSLVSTSGPSSSITIYPLLYKPFFQNFLFHPRLPSSPSRSSAQLNNYLSSRVSYWVYKL